MCLTMCDVFVCSDTAVTICEDDKRIIQSLGEEVDSKNGDGEGMVSQKSTFNTSDFVDSNNNNFALDDKISNKYFGTGKLLWI